MSCIGNQVLSWETMPITVLKEMNTCTHNSTSIYANSMGYALHIFPDF